MRCIFQAQITGKVNCEYSVHKQMDSSLRVCKLEVTLSCSLLPFFCENNYQQVDKNTSGRNEIMKMWILVTELISDARNVKFTGCQDVIWRRTDIELFRIFL